jgi:hypothetical protein
LSFQKTNSRYFYQQLIEFDELNYAFKILLEQLNKCIAQKIRPREIHTLPLTHIDTLLGLASSGEKPELFEVCFHEKFFN